jgi:hypothetical protein
MAGLYIYRTKSPNAVTIDKVHQEIRYAPEDSQALGVGGRP